MKLIIRKQFNQKISTDFNYAFNLDKSGLYTILISARCQSGEQIGIRGGEDLRVEINGRTLREVPPKARPQYKDIPSAWSGTQLKNLKKTVVFLFYLNKGNHIIKFIPYKGAFLEEIKVWELNSQTLSFEIEEQAEDGDCRPWITFVLVDLPLKTITADITVKWRLGDSDDVKLIIDSKIKKNSLSILHRNWLWSSNIFKKLLQKERQEKTLREDLVEGIHYIEFWADRMPVLHSLKLEIGKFQKPFLKGWIIDPNEGIKEVKIRSEPSNKNDSTIIDRISIGEEVEILEEIIKGDYVDDRSDIWHRIKYRDKTGYVLSTYVDIEGKTTKDIQLEIIEKAKELKIDPEIILALVECESHFKQYAVSEANAKGVMQLAPILIKDLNDSHRPYYSPIDDPFDIDQNIIGGVKYFRWLYYERYKNDKDRLRKALAAYNSGHNSVEVGKPLELELYGSQTKRIISCVQNHLKKKTFEKILNIVKKTTFALFIGVLSLFVYDELIGPSLEMLFSSNSVDVVQIIKKDKEVIITKDEQPKFPDIIWDQDLGNLTFYNSKGEKAGIISWERLNLDKIFDIPPEDSSRFSIHTERNLGYEIIELPQNTFYFLVSTSYTCGQNCTHAFFKFDANKNKLEIIDKDIFGTAINFYLSPDSQELAMVSHVHGSVCDTGSYLEILDLNNFQKEKIDQFKDEFYPTTYIKSLIWEENGEIELETYHHDCENLAKKAVERHFVYNIASKKIELKSEKDVISF